MNKDQVQQPEEEQKEELQTPEEPQEVTNATEQENEQDIPEAELSDADKLTAALTEVAELKKEMLYRVAEFENYRKRTIKEKADLIANGGKKVIEALLPVLDDLERAEQHTSAENSENDEEGLLLILQKLRSVLATQGLESFECKGEPFDTDLHEAVTMFAVPEEEMKGKVFDCIQTGYKLNGQILRHAKVVVGQ